MNKIKHFLKKQKLTSLLRRLTKTIYSDTALISSEQDRQNFVLKFSKKQNKLSILTTCLTIQHITRYISYQSFYNPVDKGVIHEIMSELDSIEKFSIQPELAEQYQKLLISAVELNLQKTLRLLRLTSSYLENGRIAYKQNPYSFEGSRYIREKNNKRPLTIKEQQDCKQSSEKITRLDQEVKEAKEKYEDTISRLRAQAALDKLTKEVNDEKNSNRESN